MCAAAKQEVYLGVDVGTSALKGVVLGRNGSVLDVFRETTPVYRDDGVDCISIRDLDERVDRMVHGARSRYRLVGMAAASVGESVVPVKEGKPLCDPIMWYDTATYPMERRILPEHPDLFSYRRVGIPSSYTMGVYKMLWLRERLGLEAVDAWLPISSYVSYRYTGEPMWDYSQGCRTLLLDIHERRWNGEALDRLGLDGELPSLDYMGSKVGSDEEGTAYYLGGHDHITGLFGIYQLFGKSPIIYESLGTASTTIVVADEEADEFHMDAPFTEPSGIIGVGFGPKHYFLQNAFRYTGGLLNAVGGWFTADPNPEFFDSVNREIEGREPDDNVLFFAGGDPVTGEEKSRVSMLNLPMPFEAAPVIQAAYFYLASIKLRTVNALEAVTGETPRFIAGGGLTRNRLFMQYLANVLNRPVEIADIGELTGLGAGIAAAVGAGDADTVAAAQKALEVTTIEPDDAHGVFRSRAERMLERYESLRKAGFVEYLV
jgi:sugar (pentulose or hexulose) kinase